ncbi:hypothetical protein [Nonomuraea fuscirosea]|uniref:WXG100-like domain-containing protein n=1 Tax=Nonomuraea fuscirosea TaxID=1291556 RepID=UPI003432E96E
MTHTGGIDVQNTASRPSRTRAVTIDSDTRPVWETEALPGWVVYWLIPMLSAGQKWPEASESGLSQLARAYEALGDGAVGSAGPAGSAARTVVTGWASPATAHFVTRIKALYGDDGISGVDRNARAYAQQANDFAVETQYSKLSINVAFWITVIAIGIAIVTSFFSAGASTALIGPYAAGARAALSRILVRLATVAGREAGATRLARVAVLSGATGRGAITRLLASPIGRELIEEIGEEFFIDAAAQYQQIKMGTRQDWDWQKSTAAIVGAGTGAVIGTRLSGPVSRLTSGVPGFTGRALTTGLTNTIASPVGSFIANTAVYGQVQNPFTADSLMGGFLGGAGRTGSISPFNPDVASALAHPLSTLAAAHTAAARTDAARADAGSGAGSGAGPGAGPGSGPGAGPGGPQSPDGPTAPTGPAPGGPASGGRPGNQAATRVPDQPGVPAQRTSSSSSPQGGRPSMPDPDTSAPRRAPSTPDPAPAPTPEPAPEPEPVLNSDPAADPAGDQSTGRRPGTADHQTSPATPPAADDTPAQADADASAQAGAGARAQGAMAQDGGAPTDGDPASPGSRPDDAGQTGPAQNSPAQNSSTQDGLAQNGQAQDGAAQSGPHQDGSAQNGQAQDGAAQDGAGSRGESRPADATPVPEPGDGPDRTEGAAVPTAAQLTPVARARTALVDAIGTNFPDAVMGPTGDLIVPAPGGPRVLPAATLSRIGAVLHARATETQSQADLEVEAASLLLVAQADDRFSAAAPDTAPDAGPDTSPRGAPDTVQSANAGQSADAGQSPNSGQSPDTAQPPGNAAAPVMASAPGTVTSQPVPGTSYVPGTRTGPDLTSDEARDATADLRPDHFGAEEVQALAWSPDGTTFMVTTSDGETQHFLPVVGDVDSRLMGQTELKQGTADDPHIVHLNPRVASDQLPRLWLHEVTDTLQRRQAVAQNSGQNPGQGILRRVLPGNRPTSDACVPARRNELAYLTEQWRRATTLPEKRRLAVDIDGVMRELQEHGDTPPAPPWAPGSDSRPSHAPPVPGDPLTADVAAVVTALQGAEQAIQRQIDAKRESAENARKARKKASRSARRTLNHHDAGRFERARQSKREARGHRNTQLRHTRIADAYTAALEEATRARQAYEQLLGALRFASMPPAPGEVSMADIAARLAGQATQQHQRYLDALAAALPQEVSLSAAMPAGRLAHLGALTRTVNTMLEREGIAKQFTPDELGRAIRADFHKVVTREGVVLRTGHGRSAAELRIRLTLSDLIEVIDPAVQASEMMVGIFFQAGRTVTATESGSAGVFGNLNTSGLAQMLPEGQWVRTVGELIGLGLGVSAGRNWSTSGGAGMYAQGGSVADNRSESLLFDAAAAWTVEIRTGRDEAWRGTTQVTESLPGDSAAQRLWVTHSYTDQPPRKLAWIDDARRTSALPNHVVTGMTGLEEALDALAGRLGGDFAEIGTNSRSNLRKFIIDELPSRLREATDKGIDRTIDVDGQPKARIRVKTEVVLVASRPVGGPSNQEWEEEVLVDFAASPGGVSAGGSLEGNSSAGLNIPGLQAVDIMAGYDPAIGPRLKGARSASQTYSATANGQAIHPTVLRKTRHTQGYRLELRHTFTVEKIGDPPVTLPPMRSDALVRMQERLAYRFGLPVDDAALIRVNGKVLTDADGNDVLRGDPLPLPIKGRKTELPEIMGDGPGQIRGAGPGIVQELFELDGFTEEVIDQLADKGLVPRIVDGVPQYSSNALERASQVLNLQEIVQQLSERRLRTAYSQVAQDGILVDLVMHGLNQAPDHYTVRLSLKQDFSDRGTYVGVTEEDTNVDLDIGTDTSARAISRSRTYSGGPSASMGDGPEEGHDGLKHEVGVNAGGNVTSTAGSSTGGTLNVVTLGETKGAQALLDVKHVVSAELLHDGETTPLASRDGKARLSVPLDLLPVDGPAQNASVGKPTRKLMSRATLLALDVQGAMDAARRVLPAAMREDSPAYHHIAAFLNTRNLVSHPEMLQTPINTDVAIRPQGVAPTQSSLAVQGELGEAEVIGVVDHVVGRIMFGLGSAGVSWGGSTGHSIGASTGLSDLDGGGTQSDGGTLSLPSRSGGTSTSTSILDIWGTEELTIEFGRQYMLRADMGVTFTGSETYPNALPTEEGRIPAGKPGTAAAEGAVLFSIPEYDALRMYADGDLALPLHLVADAVERFRNGSLTLDRNLAVPLVNTYVKALSEARARGEEPALAKRHTAKSLLKSLRDVAGLGPEATRARQGEEERQLDQVLSDAQEHIRRTEEVVLAPQYENGMGLSVVESFDLTDDQGEDVNLLDAVLHAVDEAMPGAEENTPTLRREVSVDFAGDRAQIRIPSMWSSNGFEKTYHVQSGRPADGPEAVTVRVRLEPAEGADPRKGRLLGHTSDSGIIIQRYRYTDLSHVEAYNGSYSAGVDTSSSDDGDGTGAGLSTDRGRSYSSTNNEQGTRLQRIGLFNGLNRVEQDMVLVIEVERKPARVRSAPGASTRARAAAAIKAAAERVRRRPKVLPVRYDAKLVRRLPTGMARPASEDPGPLVMVTDPRRVELHSGHFVETLRQDPGRPTLLEVVTAQLGKMLGRNTVAERRAELVARLDPSALISGFERMAGPGGDVVVRMARQKFKDQGADVTISARLSDMTVVAGPFDAEKGDVDRKADAQNVSVSRSRALPVAGNGVAKTGLGIDVGTRAGEQSSENVNDHHGARRERSRFVRGKVYTVRMRVDYDLVFQHVARLRDGDVRPVGDAVHMPAASGGEVDVTLFGEEIEELRERMESGVRIGPRSDVSHSFRFVPASGRQGLIQVLGDARLAARERGAVAVVAVREPDGLHRYDAYPDGVITSHTADGGFAEAFSTLPPGLLEVADQIRHPRLDLRHVFLNSEVEGTFTDQVTAAVRDRGALPPAQGTTSAPAPGTPDATGTASPGTPGTAAVPAAPAWPAATGPSHAPAGGSVAQGLTGGSAGSGSGASATDQAIAGTPFDAAARPEGSPDLTLAEVRAQHLSAADFGGAVANVRWAGGDRIVLQFTGSPDQHVRVLVEDPGAGLLGRTDLRAGTAADPHVMRIGPRVDPQVVSSVLVHEISHAAQASAAAAAGTRQGVVRPSLSHDLAEGTDHCLVPRLDEHAHLSRKWRAEEDPAARSRLAEAIGTLAADIERRGHTPPPPPWGTGPQRPERGGEGPIARLRGLIDAATRQEPAPGRGRSLSSLLGGAPSDARTAAAELRSEVRRAGLAVDQPGAAARTIFLARAGELTPEQIAAIRGPVALPEIAAAKAVERGAALLGARVRTHGPGLLDIQMPGRPPIAVEIQPAGRATPPGAAAAQGGPVQGVPAQGVPAQNGPAQNGPAQDGGVLTFQVDDHRTIGANERAAAATAAAAVARAMGLPVADHARLAELYEAARQVRTATAAQRPGRLGVLRDLAAAAPFHLVPAPMAAHLTTLLGTTRRSAARHAYWERMRLLNDGTGLQPPEEECRCPADGPCGCGLRAWTGRVRA